MNFIRFSVIVALLLFAAASAAASKRWCCTSTAEYAKCIRLRRSDSTFTSFRCFQAIGTEGCVQAIKYDQADMMFLDGGDIFRYRDGMIVVAAENYGEKDASYFAVAVVRRNAPASISLNNLEGLKSCHTGIGKTSGWNTPMGLLARRRNNKVNGRLQLYDPFISSCAPGANNVYYQPDLPDPTNHQKWCALCIGDRDGNNVCDRDSDERYYGYDGAFKCLKFGGGDIAFVKHVTVPDRDRGNFSLLCLDGSRAHPDDWRTCNLAKVPSHGLIMRSSTSETEAEEVVQLLKQAKNGIDPATFFDHGGRPNLLWKSSTKTFEGPYQKEPKDFLGNEYYCNMLVVTRSDIEEDCIP